MTSKSRTAVLSACIRLLGAKATRGFALQREKATDRALLAQSRDAVQAFIVAEWLGDAEHEDLPEIMAEFDKHDWRDGALEWRFEIGGVDITDVFDVTPNSGINARAAGTSPVE